MDYPVEDLVIWSDADLLVVNKPAGLLALPDGYDLSKPHLARLLEPHYHRLWIVHRLDRETSGVIVLARNPDSHRRLNQQFAERQVAKVYHALIGEQPGWDERIIALPLRTNVGRRNRTAVDLEQGKPAETHFRVLERLPAGVLLEARPLTGRMHQIRAHLFALELSILSDPLYGSGVRSTWIARMALHAASLSCWQPSSGSLLRFDAPPPPDFAAALAVMRAEC